MALQLKDSKEQIYRTTSQKQIILDYLKSVKSHPSAEKVYSVVKKKLPRISKATVYRNLKDFKKRGEAQTIISQGKSHFDADTSSHAHFICLDCNKIFDVFENACTNCSVIKNKKPKVGKIENYKINFYGHCKKCK
ncbi:MAG: hypothetical protein A2Z78_01675 [Candidatus Nealsonbacteria bacterium RBG_13_36_15]|uniref:Transcriptional repressor n=1 Tax=Candidatus Nealsonbacteria bacterium RBG_13_36_15 TaxID=1801660 RepID=A0A1G2DWZ5_9BACT|nr:MAG: hypothetical protein A2Z78_01675 [Candidatus Nealsonbacteria bacterium RBG_13_36_15]